VFEASRSIQEAFQRPNPSYSSLFRVHQEYEHLVVLWFLVCSRLCSWSVVHQTLNQKMNVFKMEMGFQNGCVCVWVRRYICIYMGVCFWFWDKGYMCVKWMIQRFWWRKWDDMNRCMLVLNIEMWFLYVCIWNRGYACMCMYVC